MKETLRQRSDEEMLEEERQPHYLPEEYVQVEEPAHFETSLSKLILK